VETVEREQTLQQDLTPPVAAPLAVPDELKKPNGSAPTSVIEKTYGISDAEYAILTKTVCKNAPREMAAFFMAFCNRRRLDPFAKHVYLANMGWDERPDWQIVTGIDGLRTIASRNALYRGQSKPAWDYDTDEKECIKTFAAQDSKNGKIAGKRKPLECEVVAYRAIPNAPIKHDALPFYGIARFDEFVKRNRDGKIIGNWESQPEHQLRIRAEAMALRMAFPEDVGSIYLEDEVRDRGPEPNVIEGEFTQSDGVDVLSDPEVVECAKALGFMRNKLVLELEAVGGDPERFKARLREFVEQKNNRPKRGEPVAAAVDVPVPAGDSDPGHSGGSESAATAAPPEPKKPRARNKFSTLMGLLADIGIGESERHEWASKALGRPIASFKTDIQDNEIAALEAYIRKESGDKCPACLADNGEPHGKNCPEDPEQYDGRLV
jgi:phage recombination protein Bet